jgi:hypothetical protein
MVAHVRPGLPLTPVVIDETETHITVEISKAMPTPWQRFLETLIGATGQHSDGPVA